jgi:hypothetical protein
MLSTTCSSRSRARVRSGPSSAAVNASSYTLARETISASRASRHSTSHSVSSGVTTGSRSISADSVAPPPPPEPLLTRRRPATGRRQRSRLAIAAGASRSVLAARPRAGWGEGATADENAKPQVF